MRGNHGARSLSEKSLGEKPRYALFFKRPRIGRRSARIPIERHRVGARASREWPRGEKRKGSPRVAPPAAGGGRFVSLSLAFLFILLLSLSRFLFLTPSCVEQVLELLSVARYMRGGPPLSPSPSPSRAATITITHLASSLASLIPRGASAVTNTINDASCHVLRLVSMRYRLCRRCFCFDERFIFPLLFSVLPAPLSCRFLHRASVPPLRSRASSLFVSAVVARSHGVSLSRISLDRNTRYVLRIKKDRRAD